MSSIDFEQRQQGNSIGKGKSIQQVVLEKHDLHVGKKMKLDLVSHTMKKN